MKIVDRMAAITNFLYYHWKRDNWVLDVRRIFRSSLEQMVNRPIFLVGNQGAGLTLISRMLRRHPKVVSISGDNRYWAGADEMQKVMLLRLPRSLRLGGRFISDGISHPYFSPPRSWGYASDDLVESYRKTEADYDPVAAEKLLFLIMETLNRHGNGHEDRRFVDKSQVFTLKVSYIDALLRGTDPQFVLITRNPYASCFRAALGKAGDMRRYSSFMSIKQRLRVCAQHWSNAMKYAIEDEDKVRNFYSFRFEDFLEDPRTSLEKLCASLDIEYSDNLLPNENQKIPFGSRYRDRWFPIRPDVNRQYLNELTPSYVEIIAERCEAIATQFGYNKPNFPS